MAKKSFITTVKNPQTKEYEQLEFDKNEFKRDYHSGVRIEIVQEQSNSYFMATRFGYPYVALYKDFY